MKKFILLAATLLLCFSAFGQEKSQAYYDGRLSEIIKKAGIPLIQVKYVSPHDSIYCQVGETPFKKMSSAQCCAEEKQAVFQAASLSKVVFAYIVLRMYDRGEIDLDKPLYKYTDIDRFKDKEMAKRLTARIILMHRSGIDDWSEDPSSDKWPASPIGFTFPVDSIFGYSGEAYSFLQRAVEKIKGKGIQAIAKEEVFERFNMPNSSYEWLPQYSEIATATYNRKGECRGVRQFPRANVAYTLRTCAKDYSNFLRVIMNGEGLKKSTHKMMITPCSGPASQFPPKIREVDKKKTIEWGLGIATEKTKKHGTILWHWGDNGSSKALFIIIPKEKKTLVYFANSACGHDIINEITSLFLNEPQPFDIERWINEE